jgi:hypothetical protein
MILDASSIPGQRSMWRKAVLALASLLFLPAGSQRAAQQMAAQTLSPVSEDRDTGSVGST